MVLNLTNLLEKLRRVAQLRIVKTVVCAVVFPSVRILVFKKTSFWAPGASIKGTGSLQVGKPWRRGPSLPGYLFIAEGGRCILKGDFQMYEGSRVEVKKGGVLTLGSGFLNESSVIRCHEAVSIGSFVLIGENAMIMDSDQHKIVGQESMSKPVEIENNVWIGANVTVLKGVKIGSGAVVAAGAVVTKDVPSGYLAAGVPAKVLRPISWVG